MVCFRSCQVRRQQTCHIEHFVENIEEQNNISCHPEDHDLHPAVESTELLGSSAYSRIIFRLHLPAQHEQLDRDVFADMIGSSDK